MRTTAAGLCLPWIPFALSQTAAPAANALMRAPRRALVVGNSRYASVPLRNPANDARDLGEALKAVGFDTVTLLDADRATLLRAAREHAASLEGRAVGLFYFAGHGLQLSWRNYLVPVDAQVRRLEDVQAQCVDLGVILEGFKLARNPMNVVILDACRDNPFGQELRVDQKGLSQFNAPPGTFVAYATAPGHVASDGGGANGLYTEHLLRELPVPEARIEDVFKRVRLGVRKRSGGLQIPWESTSLEEDFYFVRPPEVQKLAEEDAAGLARRRAELAEWDRIRDSDNAEDFYAFLQRYPTGPASEQAQFRLDQLQRPAVVAQADRDGIRPIASGASRFVTGDEYDLEYRDLLTGKAGRQTIRITKADANRVEASDGSVRDQMGTILRNASGTHTPGVVISPADIAVGKRWRTAYTSVTPRGKFETTFIDFRVTGVEELEVGGRRRKVFRSEGRGEAHADGRVTVIRPVVWFDVDTMLVLRADREFVDAAGRRVAHNSVRVTDLRLAPR